jgi:hypothetical protein
MPEQDGTLHRQQYNAAFGNPQSTRAKRFNGVTHFFEINGRWIATRSWPEPQSCNHDKPQVGLPPDNDNPSTRYAVSWEPLNDTTGTPVHISVPPQPHPEIIQYGAANEHHDAFGYTPKNWVPCSMCQNPEPYHSCPHLCSECTLHLKTSTPFQQAVFTTTTDAVPETWKQRETQKTVTPSDPVPLPQNQDGSYGPRHLLPTLAGGLVVHPDSLISATRLQYTHPHAIAWNVPLYDYGTVYVVPPKCTHCI